MRITPDLTDAAVAQALGERIGRYRIEAGLTQAELSDRAGIGKRTLERIEAGRGAELVTLIRVLRALRLLDGFDRLLPEPPPSPIAQLELRGKQRQRVAHPRGRRRTAEPDRSGQGSAPARPWTWGAGPTLKSPPPAKRSRPAKRKT